MRRLVIDSTELVIEAEDVELCGLLIPMGVDGADIFGVEFVALGLGEGGGECGFKEEVFGEIVVFGSMGLGVKIGECDGLCGEAGDLGFDPFDEGSGITSGDAGGAGRPVEAGFDLESIGAIECAFLEGGASGEGGIGAIEDEADGFFCACLGGEVVLEEGDSLFVGGRGVEGEVRGQDNRGL